MPLVSSPASAGELDGGDFTGGAAPIPDPDDLPDEIPDVPEDKPDGNDENSTPPWLKAMDNPVVDHLYSWAIGTPCWWIVLPVCGGAYTAEKWPDNPITKTGGWLGDMVGLMLYPDPDPDEWSDMILDPPPVDPGTLADKVDPSKGRGPVTNLKLYPWKLQPDNKETSEWICTYDAPKPVQLDPSGYVYEGIPSNRLSGVTAQTVQITWNGAALAGTFTSLDAGLTAEGKLCATAFWFQAEEGLQDGDVLSASFNRVMTCAGTASSGTASVTLKDPMPFADVADGAYHYDSVIWAVDHKPQITSGTLFSPDAVCTRGQIVTFLWRDMR